MEFIVRLGDWSWLAFAVLFFLVQAGAHFAGYRLGRRHRLVRGGDAEGVGLVVGAILGLLAFVLALTLSYANTRFGERRHATLEEANAISTAWLRAEAFGGPHGQQIATLLEKYASVRKHFIEAHRNSDALDQANARTSELQAEIWGHAAAISGNRPDPIVVALMQSLNDAFDMSTAQRFAHDARFPPQMFWLLIGLALVSVATLGYQFGLKGQETFVLAATLIAVWTAVIVVILDISAPRIGSIRTGSAPYDWVLESFKSGVRVPP